MVLLHHRLFRFDWIRFVRSRGQGRAGQPNGRGNTNVAQINRTRSQADEEARQAGTHARRCDGIVWSLGPDKDEKIRHILRVARRRRQRGSHRQKLASSHICSADWPVSDQGALVERGLLTSVYSWSDLRESIIGTTRQHTHTKVATELSTKLPRLTTSCHIHTYTQHAKAYTRAISNNNELKNSGTKDGSSGGGGGSSNDETETHISPALAPTYTQERKERHLDYTRRAVSERRSAHSQASIKPA